MKRNHTALCYVVICSFLFFSIEVNDPATGVITNYHLCQTQFFHNVSNRLGNNLCYYLKWGWFVSQSTFPYKSDQTPWTFLSLFQVKLVPISFHFTVNYCNHRWQNNISTLWSYMVLLYFTCKNLKVVHVFVLSSSESEKLNTDPIFHISIWNIEIHSCSISLFLQGTMKAFTKRKPH